MLVKVFSWGVIGVVCRLESHSERVHEGDEVGDERRRVHGGGEEFKGMSFVGVGSPDEGSDDEVCRTGFWRTRGCS